MSTDEQPRYLTLIDLLRDVFHVTVISTGCYIGYAIGGTYLTLLLGGLIGRAIGLAFCIGLLRLAGHRD